MSDTVFLDVNIFMYAAGTAHEYKDASLQVLVDVESGVLPAAINTEILQELLYRYSHIRLTEKGIQLCRNVLQYPLTVLSVTKIDVQLAIDFLETYDDYGLKPRDAIHAATMKSNGLTQIISADKDFDHLPFLVRTDPLSYQTASQ